MKKVQISLLVVLVALLTGASNTFANCYTDKCKSSNNGRPIIINRMNGTDSQARSHIKVLESKNTDQDKEIGNLKSDITTLDTNIKNVASDVKTLDGNIKTVASDVKTVDGKVTTLGTRVDGVEAKNNAQDNSMFNTWLVFAVVFIALLAAVLYAIFGRRNHQPNQIQGQGNQNQNNGQQAGGQGQQFQQAGNQNQQMMFQPQTVVPAHHLQYAIPTVVAGHAPAIAPIVPAPVVPPVVTP